jgi:hypothetical protein
MHGYAFATRALSGTLPPCAWRHSAGPVPGGTLPPCAWPGGAGPAKCQPAGRHSADRCYEHPYRPKRLPVNKFCSFPLGQVVHERGHLLRRQRLAEPGHVAHGSTSSGSRSLPLLRSSRGARHAALRFGCSRLRAPLAAWPVLARCRSARRDQVSLEASSPGAARSLGKESSRRRQH